MFKGQFLALDRQFCSAALLERAEQQFVRQAVFQLRAQQAAQGPRTHDAGLSRTCTAS